MSGNEGLKDILDCNDKGHWATVRPSCVECPWRKAGWCVWQNKPLEAYHLLRAALAMGGRIIIPEDVEPENE